MSAAVNLEERHVLAHRALVSAGGYMSHLLPLGNGTRSLCGYEPANTPGSRMRRARWSYAASVGYRLCGKCAVEFNANQKEAA